MSVRLEQCSREGFAALSFENAALRVVVVPQLGAKVTELVDKAASRDVLWHNPRTGLREAPYGAHFDDWWSGGWDEIFPSGDRGVLHGETLPYMGEMWAVPWTAHSWRDGDEAFIETTGLATIAPARMTRTLSLRGDEPFIRARYVIENLDVRPLPFVWGIHPAFAVTPSHRIDHPGKAMLVGVSSDPSMGEIGTNYAWPHLPDPSMDNGARDARLVRPREDAVFGGHWVTDLPAGWLALTDRAIRRGVALVFPKSVFPCAWLWQVYGGWRGHHHVCLEPWTAYPMQLDQAVEAGRDRLLMPGCVLEAEIRIVLYDGLEGVASVESSGDGYEVR